MNDLEKNIMDLYIDQCKQFGSLFTLAAQPLSQSTIVQMLTTVRENSVSPFSNYKVGAVVEVRLSENLYFYTYGVNVEDNSHNRLSLHSEQNALASAISLLGGDTKFSTLWVMAAPANAVPDPTQQPSKSCGHCRQIMISLSQSMEQIYAVTLDGRFSSPPDNFEEGQFLPDAFSEKDVNPDFVNLNSDIALTDFHSKLQLWKSFTEPRSLTEDEIKQCLQKLSPHIISADYQTSPITACIVKCNNGYYTPGVLVQDIAFLTTDTIFAAIGHAVTRFGGENLWFDEIHLASEVLNPDQLTSAEIEALTLGHYAHDQTMVYFYTTDHHASYTFEQCRRARSEMLRKEFNF